MMRPMALVLAFLILLTAIPGSRSSAAERAIAGLTLDYSLKALKDDHPEVTLTVKGAPSGTTVLALQMQNFKEIREAFSDVRATSPGGQPLPWRWSERGISVENAGVRDFEVRYTLNALMWEGGAHKSKTIFFRDGYLFFVAGEVLLMPDADPKGITVRFALPPGNQMFSNLPEQNGVFTAETSLWGSLRYDFPMAYFMGGVPLYAVERTSPWGDKYQIIRFERDPINWSPFWGTTPWEEADLYLATYQKYWDYIQQHILPPLPRHKVLFADRDHNPGPGINGVGINTDWYHFIQYWGRDMDADVVHHIIHAWSFWSINTKLAFNFDSLGALFREGLPTYYEHTLPPIVSGWDWAPGKLFEFWVLDQRGRGSGIQQNYYHQTYNQSGLRVYLLDQYIRRTTNKDLSALTRALWDEVKDQKAPATISADQIRHAFASVVGSQNVSVIDQIAARSEFSRADFVELEPAFRRYVDHWAQERFWDKPLLFAVYLEMAATRGDTWPHYATNPMQMQGMAMEAMRQFQQALASRAGETLSRDELLTALSEVTGQQHSGFFEFWSSLGYELDPNSLLPLSTMDRYAESDLYVLHNVGGTLQTEHYLSGLSQQAMALLDDAAPTDTIEIEVALRSFDGLPPVAEVERALSGPNVKFQWSHAHQHRNIYQVSGLFTVRTNDPERRRFSFTLNLPAFSSHPRFSVITGRDANGEANWNSRYPYPPELYFLHSFDPIPFTAALDGDSLHLGSVPLPNAYFQVIGLKAVPGETVTLPAGSHGDLPVDLYDQYGFLRGRQTVARPELPSSPELAPSPAPAPSPQDRPISITLNGRPITFDVPPVRVNGRLLVPVRALGEALGAQVYWDEAAQTAVLIRGEAVIRLTLGQARAEVSGRIVPLDAPPELRGGRVLAPLRFVAEALDLNVHWDDGTQTASLATK